MLWLLEPLLWPLSWLSVLSIACISHCHITITFLDVCNWFHELEFQLCLHSMLVFVMIILEKKGQCIKKFPLQESSPKTGTHTDIEIHMMSNIT